VSARGGNAVLAVNPSREWLPRPARVAPGVVRGTLASNAAPSLRAAGWPYAVAILLLCAEWLLRRRRGLR